MGRFVVACAVLLVLTVPSLATAQRLPGGVTPSHYTLWFAPDLTNRTFRGRTTIDVQIASARTSITLNAAEITFGAVTVSAGERNQEARVTLDGAHETATLTVAQSLPAGPAVISINYSGVLNDQLHGFYLSNANNRSYAITQMEATDARRAFPSFDEPSYKATFDISLTVDAGDSVISNGRQLSDTPGPEPRKHTLTFATTPKMSTYLVAMLVGDFVCRDGKTDDIPIRVCATPDKLHLTAFALEAAEQQLQFFNRYFGITYPFGKLDLVGVPDLAAGAMENIGAIAFREQDFLTDADNASLKELKNVASATAHEIAHQWFGDLVTMRWWDDIWLNEGFATWLANKPLAEWKPEWHIALDEADETQQALSLDVLRSTRPIRTNADTPGAINELFDAIAYQKTGAVLRMLEAYVGREPMRAGITAYLRKHAYGNTTGEEFWNEMARSTGQPVDRIMKSFVEQPGAPLLTVRTSCSAGTSTVTLSQQRFVAATDRSPSAAPTWTLPACLTFAGGQPRCEVIDRPAQTIRGGSCDDFVFANAGSRGYYVTDYAPESLRALTRSVDILSPVEQISLIGDEWWMARSSRHDIGGYLDLAEALARNESPVITTTLTTRLAYTTDFIASSQRDQLQAWIRRSFGPALNALGLPGRSDDDEQRQSRRASLLRLVGLYGNDADVQRLSRDLAARYVADRTTLPAAMAGAVLNVAALHGDAPLYTRFMNELQNAGRSSEEYYRFLTAIAWFADPALVRRTLDFLLAPDARSQDVGSVIMTLMTRPAAQDATWAFVKAHWSELTNKIGMGLTPELVSAAGNFCSLEAADDVRKFFAQNPVPSSARTVQRAVERIEACGDMRTRQAAALSRYVGR